MQTVKLKLDAGALQLMAEAVRKYVIAKPTDYQMQLGQCVLAEMLVRIVRQLAFPQAVNSLRLKPSEALALNHFMKSMLAACEDHNVKLLAYGIVMAIDTKLIN